MEIGFASLAWVRSAVQLAAMLPISLAGIGIREGGFIVLLEPYGVPNDEAVALGILVFSSLILNAGVGAVLEARGVFLNASGRDAAVESEAVSDRRGGHEPDPDRLPLVQSRDLGLVFSAPLAWILPQSLWHPMAVLLASLGSRASRQAQ